MGIWKLDDSITASDPVDKLIPQTGTGQPDASLNINSHNSVENAAVTAAINTINNDLNKGSVYVIGNSGETASSVFNRLYALIDQSKLSLNSHLVVSGICYCRVNANALIFAVAQVTASGAITEADLASTNSKWLGYWGATHATTDLSSSLDLVGLKVELFY